jgi:ribosomal protein L37AE/L43A
MTSRPATPFFCPFCGEEELRPQPENRWHCRTCRRLFSVTGHGSPSVPPVPPTTEVSPP